MDGGLKGGNVGKVAGNVERGWAAFGFQRVDEMMCRFVLDVEEGDAGALMGEMADEGFANAGSSAGDEDGAAAETGVTRELIREFMVRLWIGLRLWLVTGVVRHR